MAKIVWRSAIVKRLLAESLAGHCVLLCGPRFVGKTAVLREIEARVRLVGRPCGFAPHTRSLRDVTQALLGGYPQPDEANLNQRRLRSRLRRAVEEAPGVLLLDHLECAGASMAIARAYLDEIATRMGSPVR